MFDVLSAFTVTAFSNGACPLIVRQTIRAGVFSFFFYKWLPLYEQNRKLDTENETIHNPLIMNLNIKISNLVKHT